MKNYYRIILGYKSMFADESYQGNFIGVYFLPDDDLTGQFPDNWKAFNQNFIPVYMAQEPDKSKIAAGLACGSLWTLGKGMQIGDIVLSPNGSDRYYVGEILDDYAYHAGTNLPHRRTVKWYSQTIDRNAMSDQLKNSTGSVGPVSDISKYGEEIETLVSSTLPPTIISTGETVEDPVVLVPEIQLDENMVQNEAENGLGDYKAIILNDDPEQEKDQPSAQPSTQESKDMEREIERANASKYREVSKTPWSISNKSVIIGIMVLILAVSIIGVIHLNNNKNNKTPTMAVDNTNSAQPAEIEQPPSNESNTQQVSTSPSITETTTETPNKETTSTPTVSKPASTTTANSKPTAQTPTPSVVQPGGWYEGDIKNGQPNGYGIYHNPDGSTVVGQWEKGKYIGP